MFFTKANAAEMAARSVASRKANGWRARAKTFIEQPPPEDPQADALERTSRLWAIIAAIDRRLAAEVIRDRPNGQLMRDLATTRRTLLAEVPGKASDPPPTKKTSPAPSGELPEPEPDP